MEPAATVLFNKGETKIVETLQVRRQDVSRRYHEQEIGVFVGACPISAPGAPCLVEILKFL